MIRQLRRLTRAAPALGPGTLAIAVYAEARDGQLHTRAAAEQGFEGVACVDDAARAAGLYAAIWRQHGFPWAREAADGLLRFVGAMQDDTGGFVNFILDWDGHKNLDGSSSQAGGGPWTARAMHALACGVSAFGNEACRTRFERGLPWLDRPTPYLDVRAVAVLAALEYWEATGAIHVGQRALRWAEAIAEERVGDVLPDIAGRAEVHLWGHLQEAALARAGRVFGRADLIDAACRSAEAVLAPQVERRFDAGTVQPFDVSCVVRGLDAVAQATAEARYRRLADQARAWFHGRNRAGQPVYDQARGLVYDGIDDGRVSANSGAEANIEGALALLDSLPWGEYEQARAMP